MKHTPDFSGTSFSVDEIEAGLKIAARLFKRYGEPFRAYFVYLENELSVAKDRDDVVDRISALLSQTDS